MITIITDTMLVLALRESQGLEVSLTSLVNMKDTISIYLESYFKSIVATYPREFRDELSYWYEAYSDSGYFESVRGNDAPWDYKTYLLEAISDIVDLNKEYLLYDRNDRTFGENMKSTRLIKYAKQLKSQISK